MHRLSVHASRQYDILIGSGLLAQTGTLISSLVAGRKAAIISDTNIWPIYGENVTSALNSSGFCTESYIIPAGEESKSLQTYSNILAFLTEHQFCREDVIIALGGGVVGDLTGFAAATYLRGIAYVQAPTSLLAMVDSSVGGKTAVNLPQGKNLVGTFYQPILVICDTDVLSTLPSSVFADGCAEIIKYSILYDPELFQQLLNSGLEFAWDDVITRCVELKCTVVSDDEFDKGVRKLLNLGHTFAHAIELASDYDVTHGQGVAAGIAMAARTAYRLGHCSQDTVRDIVAILDRLGLPTTTTYSAEELNCAILTDKKRKNDRIDLILPEKIGKCRIESVNLSEFFSFIEACL